MVSNIKILKDNSQNIGVKEAPKSFQSKNRIETVLTNKISVISFLLC